MAAVTFRSEIARNFFYDQRKQFKRLWEMSDIVEMLEIWEAATEAASRQ